MYLAQHHRSHAESGWHKGVSDSKGILSRLPHSVYSFSIVLKMFKELLTVFRTQGHIPSAPHLLLGNVCLTQSGEHHHGYLASRNW